MASDKMNANDVDAFEAKDRELKTRFQHEKFYQMLKSSFFRYKIDTKGENINLSWSPDGKYVCVGNKDDLLSFIDCTQNPPSMVKILKNYTIN